MKHFNSFLISFLCCFYSLSLMAIDDTENNALFEELWENLKTNEQKSGGFEQIKIKEQQERDGDQLKKRVKNELIGNDQSENENYAGKFGKIFIKIEGEKSEEIKKEICENPIKNEQQQNEEELVQSDEQTIGNSIHLINKGENGPKRVKKIFKKNEKIVLIEKFEKMKKKHLSQNGNLNKKMKQIEKEIAKMLDVSVTSIYTWKRQFDEENKNEWTKMKKLIKVFEEVKHKFILEKGKMTRNIMKIVEQKIANKIGTDRQQIFKWKRKFKVENKAKKDDDKSAIIAEFEAMKKEYLRKNGNLKKKAKEIEEEIVKELGISRTTIRRWKAQIASQKKNHNKEMQGKIIEKYLKIKVENDSLNDSEIAEQLGVIRKNLYGWKANFGLTTKTHYTKEKKMEIIREFNKQKEKHPHLTNAQLSKRLKVNHNYLYKWKQQFKKGKNKMNTFKSQSMLYPWSIPLLTTIFGLGITQLKTEIKEKEAFLNSKE